MSMAVNDWVFFAQITSYAMQYEVIYHLVPVNSQ